VVSALLVRQIFFKKDLATLAVACD
jgi:hypothetical protein